VVWRWWPPRTPPTTTIGLERWQGHILTPPREILPTLGSGTVRLSGEILALSGKIALPRVRLSAEMLRFPGKVLALSGEIFRLAGVVAVVYFRKLRFSREFLMRWDIVGRIIVA